MTNEKKNTFLFINAGNVSLIKVLLKGTHTFQGDLDINLISPDGTSLRLAAFIGSNKDDFFITFSDDGNSLNFELYVNGSEFQPAGGSLFDTFKSKSVLGSPHILHVIGKS